MKFDSIILLTLPLLVGISSTHANDISESTDKLSNSDQLQQNQTNTGYTAAKPDYNPSSAQRENTRSYTNQSTRKNSQDISLSKNESTAQVKEMALPTQPSSSRTEQRTNSTTTQTTRSNNQNTVQSPVNQDRGSRDKQNVSETRNADTKNDVSLNQLRQSANRGDSTAQTNLGLLYVSGKDVPRNYETATQWFKKAAQQGNDIAQTNLGLAYKVGQGVQKNQSLAIDWFKKAAEQGNSIAQYNLGAMLVDGIGINQDRSQGIKWLKQAADQGNSRAKSALESLAAY